MKILFLTSRFPYPLDKGDKLRAYHQLVHLAKKHEVILLALTVQNVSVADRRVLEQICTEVVIVQLSALRLVSNLIRALHRGIPFQVGYFFSPRAVSEVKRMVATHRPGHVFCQLVRMAEYISKCGDIPCTIDYMDAFSKGVERRMEAAPFYLKPFFHMEHQRLLRYEAKVFDRFTNKVIISEQDLDFLSSALRQQIVVVPNGVDSDYFSPMSRNKGHELLFTGNMGYPPNIDCTLFLVRKIMPLVWQKHPSVRVLIAGADPARVVRSLQSEHVIVTGRVPDIRMCYSDAHIFVAPMRTGIGMQNKVLEAMAMRLPCITSEMVNNAIGAAPEKEILISKTPQEYAAHIRALLENPQRAEGLAENGMQLVRTKYQWEGMMKKLENAMGLMDFFLLITFYILF